MGFNWQESLTDNKGRVEYQDMEEVRDAADEIRRNSPASRVAHESTWFGANIVTEKGTFYSTRLVPNHGDFNHRTSHDTGNFSSADSGR